LSLLLFLLLAVLPAVMLAIVDVKTRNGCGGVVGRDEGEG